MTDDDTETESDSKSAEAAKIIRGHMLGSAAAGAVPIPLLDMGLVTGVQLRMLTKLAELYDVKFSEQRANAIISSLASVGVAWTAQGLLSLIPGAGKALAGVGSLVLPAAATYALGRVCVRHFASGGTFLNFDPERAQEEYDEEYEKGKRVMEHDYCGVRP